jgi:glycosyltransferase involved in cell wall biosynthesis
MKKICFVVSSPMTVVVFLKPHIKSLQEKYALSVIANTQDISLLRGHGIAVDIDTVNIERTIFPRHDLLSLWVLFIKFRSQHFEVVHSITPKAGLLSMLAAWLARVPVRIHWFTGQVWATRNGLDRLALKWVDRLIASLATHVLVDSPSQLNFLKAEGVVKEKFAEVLADGSICGVDGMRFRPNAEIRASVRSDLHIPTAAMLILYLGRLNRDKGVLDLAKGFAILAPRHPNLWLLLVGPEEGAVKSRVLEICEHWIERVRFVGYTNQPEYFMEAADVFCLPSYREGFGSSVIEAAACGLPVVASRIYGLTDAVQEGVTGLLHPAGDVSFLAHQIERLVEDCLLRQKMGAAARKRVLRDFSQVRLTEALKGFYFKILNE